MTKPTFPELYQTKLSQIAELDEQAIQNHIRKSETLTAWLKGILRFKSSNSSQKKGNTQ